MAFDWNAAIMHPLTQLGAGMMMGADPQGRNLGGIGVGLQSARDSILQQRQLEQQAEAAQQMADYRQAQIEQTRAQMQGTQSRLQMEQEAARLRREEATREQQQREAYAAATPEQRLQMGAAMFPKADYERLIREAATPKPVTEMGKLNLALRQGTITQPQYDALSTNLMQPNTGHLSMQVDPQGNAVLQDKLAGTVTFVAPSGEQRQTRIGTLISPPPDRPAVEIVQQAVQTPEGAAVQETTGAMTPEGPVVQEQGAAVPQLGTFQQQEWNRAFSGMPAESQNRYTASQMVRSRVPGIIERVRANPAAFGAAVGGAYYMPEAWRQGLIGKAYEEYQAGQLSAEQAQARADVFREASTAINALSGAAVSETEAQRLSRFLPKETDSAAQIVNKLEGAIREATTTVDALGQQFGVPKREPAQTGEGGWQTSPSGVRYRWK